jgi:hypothetical protein
LIKLGHYLLGRAAVFRLLDSILRRTEILLEPASATLRLPDVQMRSRRDGIGEVDSNEGSAVYGFDQVDAAGAVGGADGDGGVGREIGMMADWESFVGGMFVASIWGLLVGLPLSLLATMAPCHRSLICPQLHFNISDQIAAGRSDGDCDWLPRSLSVAKTFQEGLEIGDASGQPIETS